MNLKNDSGSKLGFIGKEILKDFIVFCHDIFGVGSIAFSSVKT